LFDAEHQKKQFKSDYSISITGNAGPSTDGQKSNVGDCFIAISSENEKAHNLEMKQMRGGFSDEIQKLRNKFIKFASNLYKGDEYWIRPLDKDVSNVFKPETNKAFKKGEVSRWIIEEDGEVLGRIAAFYQKDNMKGDLNVGGCGFFECINKLKEFKIVDTEYLINKNVNRKKKVLAEGAQGTLLDIDFGSYPFVTSSNTTTAGACIGLGISPKKIDKVFGIFKAYCTRVGAGPFPTELFDDIGEKIAKNGNEFGSTTGRPRRCGWLDLPALKYSIMLNGVSDLYMMKADVLSGFSEVKVCVGYEYNNEKIDYFPSSIESDSIKPIYKSFKGWTSKSNHARSFDDLEDNFKKYINFIESEVGVSIKLVSLGPDREETIYMK